ncbi:DUF6907 domain-containing protein [Streptomyces fulvoviolaceus]|uniref:DUF6907 domain-containing protein n=1 Tax=Streptomyces fulvoviolaceus TaxID=285535 RepID=UPI0021BE633F|nr:hypothetical protein [Streptomyces fulvoviolaceus]MCT9078813.1 hypothetical protein [Streptomyces fulvoviolaceus]
MTTIATEQITAAMASVTCPSWCLVDHAEDFPVWGDVFHRSDVVQLLAPKASRPPGERHLQGPRLAAHLMVPELPQKNDPPAVILDHGDVYGPYAQLEVEHLDQYIRDLKTFTARLQDMRNRLAEIQDA